MNRAPGRRARRPAGSVYRNGGIAVIAALATIASTGQMVSAAPDHDAPRAFTEIDLGAGGGGGIRFTPAAESNRPVSVMLELQGQPVAAREAAAQERGRALPKQNERAIAAQLKGRQDQIRSGISRAGGTVVAQLQWAYNGVQVEVRQKDIPQLAALPGVVGVHEIQSFEPDNSAGVPYIGGPEVWEDTGETGEGVKVAVIDTGVDYTHATFGGPGTVEAYEEAAAGSTTLPADGTWYGPGAPKVKGGWDFTGDDYNADAPGSLPQPDPNPLDCNGHGTHVAGTAAGFGVLGDGTTYDEPYKANTVSANDWNVGPGVAPEAEVYAYRVFGCEGSSDVVALAIDKAVQDGVDVINMSLGSSFGGTEDPTSVAAENAALSGITVVASAGNAGHNAYITGSPGTADHVLSVAALDASRESYPGATLALSTGETVETIVANGEDLPGGELPVKVLKDSDGGIGLGCELDEYRDADVAGALVVTARGVCARVARAVFGQQAGALAVLMINSDQAFPPYEGPITGNPDTGEAYDVTIPFLGAPGIPEETVKLLAADGGTVTLSASELENDGYRAAAGFTSGGPRNPDSAPKPEVTAPGVSVASAGVGTGDGFAVISGTSMAAPMTAGAAALVQSANPTWGGDRIKAALQNTAEPTLNRGYDSRLSGTGVVQAQRAVDAQVLATTEDGLNSLAFGYVPGTGAYEASESFTLTNHGDTAVTYDISVDANGDQHGADIAVSPETVTVSEGGTATVTATLSMSADGFAALPGASTYVTGPGQVTTVRGAVVATPQDEAGQDEAGQDEAGQDEAGQGLRIAYLMVPRGLSDVTAGQPGGFRPAGGGAFTSTLPLTNEGVHDGTADLYAWGITDAQDTGGRSMDIRDVGVQVLPGAALGGSADDRSMVFAVNAWGKSTNQAVNEFDIAIDNDRDGTTDYWVVGVDLGAVLAGSFDGRMGSFVIDAATGSVLSAFFADAPMNGSVVMLPAMASDLGITGQQSAFDYSAFGFSIQDSSLADPTSIASFDAFRPPVSSGQWAEVPAGGSASVPLSFVQSRQQAHGALGWLAVTVDDAASAAQADRVSVPRNPGRGR